MKNFKAASVMFAAFDLFASTRNITDIQTGGFNLIHPAGAYLPV